MAVSPLKEPVALLERRDRPTAQGDGSQPLPSGLSVATIYDEHFEFVWRGLRRLGVAADQLEDAVQDVFVVVQRRLGDFEQRSSVRTWLFGIALRVAKEHRRLRRKRAVDVALAEDALVGTDPDPREAALQAEASAVVQALLDALDDERRAVFVMLELEDFTAPEVAQVLGIGVNSVYSRMRLARRDLEQELKRHRARNERNLR